MPLLKREHACREPRTGPGMCRTTRDAEFMRSKQERLPSVHRSVVNKTNAQMSKQVVVVVMDSKEEELESAAVTGVSRREEEAGMPAPTARPDTCAPRNSVMRRRRKRRTS